MKIVEFTVEGKGEFPFEMLSHDRCYPRTREDAMAMLLAFPRRWRRGERSLRDPDEPRLHRIALASATGLPAVDRWASYGWTVSEVVERPD